MMIKTYPALLKQVEDNIRVSFPDFPEAKVICGVREDVKALAQECLAVTIEYRMRNDRPLPEPTSLDDCSFAVEIAFADINLNKTVPDATLSIG